MTPQTLDKITTLPEQRYLLPGYYTWEEFEKIAALTADAPGLRITYLDGCVEFLTVGEQNEIIKSILALLLETYFFEKASTLSLLVALHAVLKKKVHPLNLMNLII